MLYRQRIGMFGQGRFNTRSKQHTSSYNPFVRGSDIHYRTFALFSVILWVLSMGVILLRCVDVCSTVFTNEPDTIITKQQCQFFCHELQCLQTLETFHMNFHLPLHDGNTRTCFDGNNFAGYYQLKLLRSAG